MNSASPLSPFRRQAIVVGRAGPHCIRQSDINTVFAESVPACPCPLSVSRTLSVYSREKFRRGAQRVQVYFVRESNFTYNFEQ